MLSSNANANASPHPPASRARVTWWATLGVIACLLLLAACGGSSSTAGTSGAATIPLSTSSFSGTTSVTIKAGQAVTFTSNGTHDLVIGTNGHFSAENGAPSGLNSSGGVAFSPGDTKTIVFPSAGTFPITCTIHPSMQATIKVTP